MMIKIIKKYPLTSFMACLLIIKILMVSGMPIFALGEAVHDNKLMINNSTSLLNGQWLGEYNEITLIKGVFFPLFLAASNRLNISYTVAVSIMYVIGCIIFIVAIKDLITNKKILMFIYTVLLFSPVSYSVDAFQRVYRKSKRVISFP